MPMNHLDLMQIEADTAFTYDARGRMLLSNEPLASERHPAQRFCLFRTRDGHVTRFGAALPDDVAAQLTEIVAREPLDGDLRAPPVTATEIEAALARHAPVGSGGSGPAYHFPESIPAQPGTVVRVTAETRDLVRETFPWLTTEYDDWWPAFVTLHDGVGVSACFSSRIGPLAMAAGVETLPEYRQRGYAAAATAAWGAAVRAAGRVPVYGTSWDNLASQGVARRVGLRMHGSATSWV
jgi:hypothetical protein